MVFGRQKQASEAGWTAVVFGVDGIAVADVERRTDARPQVQACDGYAREGGDLDALKRLRNAKRLARHRCTTLLRHGQYQLLQVEAPDNADTLPRGELREAVRWRVKEMLDFAVDRAGIDILDIPVPAGRTPQLWVVAASHDVLTPCVRMFQDARTRLAAIDIPELAQRNLAGLFEEENRGLALVAFDPRDKGGGWLTVSYRGELFMSRHLDASGPDLARPGAEALHERVLLDIQRTLDSFDRNFSAIPLTRLLVGPLPGGDAFVDYLGNNLGLPVARADLADVLDIQAVPGLSEPAAQAEAWLALGAALRDQ